MLNFTDKVVGTIEMPLAITEQDIEGVIVSSFEGGSNFWALLHNDKPEFADKPKDEPSSTWATKLLLDGKSVYFSNKDDFYAFQDDGGEEPEVFELTLAKLLEGIKLNNTKRPFASDKNNWDANDADCIIQYALFGKQVYN